MLSIIIIPVLFLLGAVASPLRVRDDCTTFPSWTITDFHSNTTDTVGSGGSASFKLTNNLSGASDELNCSLQVNYRCIITGTPSDKNLTVHVAVRASSLTLILDKVVDCAGSATPVHVIGNGDLDLSCSWDEDVGGKVTCALVDKNSTIQGAVVELAPGR